MYRDVTSSPLVAHLEANQKSYKQNSKSGMGRRWPLHHKINPLWALKVMWRTRACRMEVENDKEGKCLSASWERESLRGNWYGKLCYRFAAEPASTASDDIEVGRVRTYVEEYEKMKAGQSTTLPIDFGHLMQANPVLQQVISEQYLRYFC